MLRHLTKYFQQFNFSNVTSCSVLGATVQLAKDSLISPALVAIPIFVNTVGTSYTMKVIVPDTIMYFLNVFICVAYIANLFSSLCLKRTC